MKPVNVPVGEVLQINREPHPAYGNGTYLLVKLLPDSPIPRIADRMIAILEAPGI